MSTIINGTSSAITFPDSSVQNTAGLVSGGTIASGTITTGTVTTLTTTTISDGTNSTSSTNCIQGSAKAWVNVDGNGSATVRASYNVSSVTYISAGYLRMNFTNAMPDTNYVVLGTASDDGVSATLVCSSGTWTSAQSTSGATMFIGNTGAGYNRTYNGFVVFR